MENYLTCMMKRLMYSLWESVEYLERELPAVNDETTPYNCATWMLAAFPEANMVCPLGVPRLCAPRDEYFKAFEEGLELM
eukprot:2984414-Prymnesium_polylepis.1